jgi:hypothetical protein
MQASGVPSAKMVAMDTDPHVALLPDVDDTDRQAAEARLHDLYSQGALSHQQFSLLLDLVYAAAGRVELEAVLAPLPPLVRFTPVSRRLAGPFVLRVADRRLRLGPGWQLAAQTTVSTGAGQARLDLTEASWDAKEIHLRLETWGRVLVLVPVGVTVQALGRSGRVDLTWLAPPLPGGPVVRITTGGPTGTVRVRHPKALPEGPFSRWRLCRGAGRVHPLRRRDTLGGPGTSRYSSRHHHFEGGPSL